MVLPIKRHGHDPASQAGHTTHGTAIDSDQARGGARGVNGVAVLWQSYGGQRSKVPHPLQVRTTPTPAGHDQSTCPKRGCYAREGRWNLVQHTWFSDVCAPKTGESLVNRRVANHHNGPKPLPA